MLSVAKVLLLFQLSVIVNNNLMFFMRIVTKGDRRDANALTQAWVNGPCPCDPGGWFYVQSDV